MSINLKNDLELITRTVSDSRISIIRYRGKLYNYIINPISTGLSSISPDILRSITRLILSNIDDFDIDYILTFEAMGIHIATALSLELDVPVVLAKKKDYTGNMVPIIRGEMAEALYLDPEIAESRILIVDSIIANGSTITGAIKALESMGCKIIDIIVVIERVDKNGAKRVEAETGYKVKSLVKVAVSSDNVEIIR
jgi:adenine phosphoribosyltransferase